MARVEERVAHLEGHMNELSQRLSGVEGAIRHLEQRTDTRFDSVDRRFDALDAKVSRQFMWLVGIQITTLVAIIVALISRA